MIQVEPQQDSGLVAELRAERDEAIAASQSKSEFLAAISHELRTPLNAIIGFSDVMKQRLFGPMPTRYAEYGELIHESGVHLLDLIGDVLDMSKIEAERYELDLTGFDVRDIIKRNDFIGSGDLNKGFLDFPERPRPNEIRWREADTDSVKIQRLALAIIEIE